MPLLYQQIRDAILRDIRSGVLREGDPVPSELELAQRFGVSRITSKKALDTLRQDGVVVRERGRGTFVAGGATSSPTLPQPSTPRRIGFVVPDMSDTFGVRILNGIDDRARECGYQLVLRRTRGQEAEESRAIAEFVATGLDGLIVFPVHGEYYNPELLRHVLAGFPVVLVDRVLPGIPVSTVCTDNVAAAHRLTSWLIERGHTYIGFVSPPVNRTSSIAQRLRGFESALGNNASGATLTTIQGTLPGNNLLAEYDADRQRVLAFLDAHPDLTAIVACESTLAQLVRKIVQESGRPEPEITCFDAVWDPFGRYAFTHIRQHEHQIGIQAVDQLIACIETGAPPQHLLIDFDLIEAAPATPSLVGES